MRGCVLLSSTSPGFYSSVRQSQPVNTLFRTCVAARKKREGKARSTGHCGPMARLCSAAPAFFARNPQGRDGVLPNSPSLAGSQSLLLLRGSCLISAAIHHRWCQKCYRALDPHSAFSKGRLSIPLRITVGGTRSAQEAATAARNVLDFRNSPFAIDRCNLIKSCQLDFSRPVTRRITSCRERVRLACPVLNLFP